MRLQTWLSLQRFSRRFEQGLTGFLLKFPLKGLLRVLQIADLAFSTRLNDELAGDLRNRFIGAFSKFLHAQGFYSSRIKASRDKGFKRFRQWGLGGSNLSGSRA